MSAARELSGTLEQPSNTCADHQENGHKMNLSPPSESTKQLNIDENHNEAKVKNSSSMSAQERKDFVAARVCIAEYVFYFFFVIKLH